MCSAGNGPLPQMLLPTQSRGLLTAARAAAATAGQKTQKPVQKSQFPTLAAIWYFTLATATSQQIEVEVQFPSWRPLKRDVSERASVEQAVGGGLSWWVVAARQEIAGN